MSNPKKFSSFTSGLDEPKKQAEDYNANAVYGLPIHERNLSLVSGEEIRIGAFLWKPTGLAIEGEITREDWELTGKMLKKMEGSLQWLIGDLIVCGEVKKWGEQKELAEAFDFDYGTIRTYAHVCRKVDLSIRIDKLSFAHHQLVAPLSQEDQICFLESAATGENGKIWTVARLRNEIETYKGAQEAKPIPKFLKPLYQLRKAYSPKNWKAMSKGERRRVYTELKGVVENMADEFEGEE